mmetsp:Transcript_8291/g.17247  ORF Transcript_8291/g.17247 Transcript_8291/m.17247 type:complete len:222 (+) Transcript_8291:2732-3397(+)
MMTPEVHRTASNFQGFISTFSVTNPIEPPKTPTAKDAIPWNIALCRVGGLDFLRIFEFRRSLNITSQMIAIKKNIDPTLHHWMISSQNISMPNLSSPVVISIQSSVPSQSMKKKGPNPRTYELTKLKTRSIAAKKSMYTLQDIAGVRLFGSSKRGRAIATIRRRAKRTETPFETTTRTVSLLYVLKAGDKSPFVFVVLPIVVPTLLHFMPLLFSLFSLIAI